MRNVLPPRHLRSQPVHVSPQTMRVEDIEARGPCALPEQRTFTERTPAGSASVIRVARLSTGASAPSLVRVVLNMETSEPLIELGLSALREIEHRSALGAAQIWDEVTYAQSWSGRGHQFPASRNSRKKGRKRSRKQL